MNRTLTIRLVFATAFTALLVGIVLLKTPESQTVEASNLRLVPPASSLTSLPTVRVFPDEETTLMSLPSVVIHAPEGTNRRFNHALEGGSQGSNYALRDGDRSTTSARRQ